MKVNFSARVSPHSYSMANLTGLAIPSPPPRNAGSLGMFVKGLCYIARDFDAEVKLASESPEGYELPDGNIVTVGSNRIRGPEVIF
jgi:hypothetical protein